VHAPGIGVIPKASAHPREIPRPAGKSAGASGWRRRAAAGFGAALLCASRLL